MTTILVVDDELSIRDLVARVLERAGYRVIACAGAAEALAAASEADLLVVDLLLPNINGRELTEQLRRIRPDLPVVLMSGYPPPHTHPIPAPPSSFLQKPMRPAALVQEVRRLLKMVSGE